MTCAHIARIIGNTFLLLAAILVLAIGALWLLPTP